MVKISDIFVCRQCGYCCQGETTVSLDKNDQKKMVRHLGLEREEVARRFWRQTGGTVQMQVIDGHCVFYDNGCTIHAGKPWRCTQWPMHPSILADRDNYEIIRESCPGINSELGYDEFSIIFAELLKPAKNND